MQPRPEGGLWAAARLVRSEPRHCRWRGAKLRLRAGLQRALGRLSLGLSRGRCLVSQMVVSDREPFPHTAQSTFWSRGLWAALRLCVPPIVAPIRYRVVWRSTPRVLFVPCGERTAYYPVHAAARGLPALTHPRRLQAYTRLATRSTFYNRDGARRDSGGGGGRGARLYARGGGAAAGGGDRRRPTTSVESWTRPRARARTGRMPGSSILLNERCRATSYVSTACGRRRLDRAGPRRSARSSCSSGVVLPRVGRTALSLLLFSLHFR